MNYARRTRSCAERVCFSLWGARPPLQVVKTLIYLYACSVEPICKAMQVAPSGYLRHVAQQRDPTLFCTRVQCDNLLSVEIVRVWQVNLQLYRPDNCGANCGVKELAWFAARSSV